MKIEALVLCLVAIQIQLVKGARPIDEEILEALKQTSALITTSSSDGITRDPEGLFKDGEAILAPASRERLYELDMKLSERQAEIRSQNKRIKRETEAEAVAVRWPKGRIPYKIDAAAFSPEEMDSIEQAMRQWSDGSCVDFQSRASSDAAYLMITGDAADSCWSSVGYDGRVQQLNVAMQQCGSKSVVTHLLGHALGLGHTHNQANRDASISVQWDNIMPGYESNFRASPWIVAPVLSGRGVALVDDEEDDDEEDSVALDYESIMEYSRNLLSAEGDTLVTTDPESQALIGNAIRPSQRDLELINAIYDCDDD